MFKRVMRTAAVFFAVFLVLAACGKAGMDSSKKNVKEKDEKQVQMDDGEKSSDAEKNEGVSGNSKNGQGNMQSSGGEDEKLINDNAGNTDDTGETGLQADGTEELAEPDLQEIMSRSQDEDTRAAVDEFFSGSLFIGDSRTVGISMYSGVTSADFFCATGMSCFNLFDSTVDIAGIGKTGLENLLAQKSYTKVFIMLGINELGYNLDRIVEKYSNAIDTIAAAQPDAAIYVQANMHVTAARSEKDDIYNNWRINDLNTRLKAMADEKGLAFLDVNPLFDDENGNLCTDYTYDHTHVLGKYYNAWCLWIYDMCCGVKS